MKTVWIVGIASCESNEIKSVCTTKAIAERELFKARDELVKGWEDGIKSCSWSKDMYGDMIAALAGKNYDKWDNYPHECPYLYEQGVMDK